ncbi:MAG: hypothetical protein AAGE96_07450 [Cyanobacteria bacterium P01_G01_bin.19]
MNSSNSAFSRYLPQPKIFCTEYPSQPQMLYNGFGEIILGEENVIEGHLVVLMEWFPRPHPQFTFTHNAPKENLSSRSFTLKLTELGTKAEAFAEDIVYHGGGKTPSKTVISGCFCEPVNQGNNLNLSSLIFSITNFQWFNICNTWMGDEAENPALVGWLDLMFEGQFVFLTNEWRIVLGTMRDSYDLEQSLNKKGGYGITHTGKIEKLDNSAFSLEEANIQLQGFATYLSFTRGVWLSPLLLTGYNRLGDRVFEQWSNSYQADSWNDSGLIFCIDSTELPDAFSGFMNKWLNNDYQELIKESIHGYIESRKLSGGVNWAIAMQLTTLERLSWVILVESSNFLSPDGWKRLPAHDRIGGLLSYFNLDKKVPDSMLNLQQLSKEFNCEDAVKAITQIRNTIAHPISKNKQKRISDDAKYEAWNLGLEYLEFVLLKLFNCPFSLTSKF